MKKLLIFLALAIPLFASAQAPTKDSAMFSAPSTSFTPQFRFKGTSASNQRLQYYNTYLQKWVQIPLAWQWDNYVPTSVSSVYARFGTTESATNYVPFLNDSNRLVVNFSGLRYLSGSNRYLSGIRADFTNGLRSSIAPTENNEVLRLQDNNIFTSWQNSNTKYSPSPNAYYWNRSIVTTTNHNRDGAKMAVLGKYMFLLGGWHPDSIPVTDNEVYRFNQAVTSTTQLANAGWSGRHTFGLGVIADTAYVFGGDLNSGSYQKDSWKGVLQPDSTITWTLLNNNVPWGERILFGSTAHNGYLYVIGGQKGFVPEDGVLTDVWRSKDGITWEQIATGLTQFGRNITGSAVSYGGYIYVIGGGVYDTPTTDGTYQNKVWRSIDGITWEQLPDAPWAGRQYNDVVVFDGKIFTVAGNIGGDIPTDNTGDVWSLDNNGFWEQQITGLTPRHASGVAAYNNKLVVSTGNYHNDTWTLNKLPISRDASINSIPQIDTTGTLHTPTILLNSGASGGLGIGVNGADASLYGDSTLIQLSAKGDLGIYGGRTAMSTSSILIKANGDVRLNKFTQNGFVKTTSSNGAITIETPTTLSGFGIDDAFTKTESDARFAPIAVNGTVTSLTDNTANGVAVTWTNRTTTPTPTVTLGAITPTSTTMTYSSASGSPIDVNSTSGTFSGTQIYGHTVRTRNSAFDFFGAYANNGADAVFRVVGDGSVMTSSPQTTVSGSTSGSIVASMPFQGATEKKVKIYLDALSGTATYTFPTAFTHKPGLVNIPVDSGIAIITSLTTTAITLDGTTAATGFVVLEGY